MKIKFYDEIRLHVIAGRGRCGSIQPAPHTYAYPYQKITRVKSRKRRWSSQKDAESVGDGDGAGDVLSSSTTHTCPMRCASSCSITATSELRFRHTIASDVLPILLAVQLPASEATPRRRISLPKMIPTTMTKKGSTSRRERKVENREQERFRRIVGASRTCTASPACHGQGEIRRRRPKDQAPPSSW